LTTFRKLKCIFMSNILIGRKEERLILKKALESEESEMISIIGRRRVGKTYLVRTLSWGFPEIAEQLPHDSPLSGDLARRQTTPS